MVYDLRRLTAWAKYKCMQVMVKTGCYIMLCASLLAGAWAMSYFYVFLILSRTTKPVPESTHRCSLFLAKSFWKKMRHCTHVTKEPPPCCEFNSSQSFSCSCSLSFLHLAKTEKSPGKPSFMAGYRKNETIPAIQDAFLSGLSRIWVVVSRCLVDASSTFIFKSLGCVCPSGMTLICRCLCCVP